MVQLRSWMIPAEACPGTFVTLKGACGKTTTTKFNFKQMLKVSAFYLEKQKKIFSKPYRQDRSKRWR
jgi:hypothetical protein